MYMYEQTMNAAIQNVIVLNYCATINGKLKLRVTVGDEVPHITL